MGFAQVAFGVDAEWTGAPVHARTVLPDEYFVPPHTVALDAWSSWYEHIAEVRVAEFGTHADDEVLDLG